MIIFFSKRRRMVRKTRRTRRTKRRTRRRRRRRRSKRRKKKRRGKKKKRRRRNPRSPRWRLSVKSSRCRKKGRFTFPLRLKSRAVDPVLAEFRALYPER